jgi:uncharacterized protein YjbI with pentapeptide repeats
VKEMSDLSLFPEEQSDSGFDGEFAQDAEFIKLQKPQYEFHDKEFYKCHFTSCNFFKTQFIECDFEKCTFSHCDLSLVALKACRLLDVKFESSKIVGTDWTQLRQPLKFSFHDCKIDGGIFLKLTLPALNLINSSAKDCDFTEAKLIKGMFTGTDFEGSRFMGADISFADFSDAVNYSIDPTRVKLKKTIFSFPSATALLNGFDIIIK